MMKRIIITLALALSMPHTFAMQQQQQTQKQQQKQKTHNHAHHEEPKTDVAPQTQDATQQATSTQTAQDTAVQTHICTFAPEHPPCHICGCDGISPLGCCTRSDGPYTQCHGYPHLLTCTVCGLQKSTAAMRK